MSVSKFYAYLTSIYRFGIIGIIIVFDVLSGFNYEKEKLTLYAILVLYGVAFTVFRINKWYSYIELICVISLAYLIDLTIVNCLFLIPFINFMSSNAKKVDIGLFWLICVSFLFYQTENPITSAVLSIGMLATLYIFHQKFNYIEKLSDELFRNKEEIKEYRNEIQTQKLGFEITMKMFYQMRELNEGENEEQVIEKMLLGSNDFFNAMYACLYTKDTVDEEYRKTREIGDSSRFNVPESLGKDDVNKEAMFNTEMMRTPIFIDGEDWGIVAIYGKRMGIGEKGQMVLSPFNESDFETMLTYIYSVTKRISEIKISERNEIMAKYDELTQVPNRRYFLGHLGRMVDLAQRGDEFAVLVMDIDNFKSFNDTYGHAMGDSVLKIVAETVEAAIRKSDMVGRIGGEEFAVILHKPKGEGEMVANRIRKMIAAVPGPPRPITLSVGLAYFGKHGDSSEELLKNADAAMYVAKNTGKDKVVEYKYGMNMEE